MIAPLTFPKFLSGWLPSLALVATVDPGPRLADLFAFSAGGMTIPPVTCLLGAAGVLLARPLARRSEGTLGWRGFALVSLIMLIVVELWVLESRPGALFAFVVAIGLGFSGYSLIELIGEQVRSFLKNIVGRASDAFKPRAPGEPDQ